MRALRVIVHCQRCGKEDTYTLVGNEDSENLHHKCTKCRIPMTIDRMNLIYEDNEGNRVEECVVNTEKGN